MLAAMTPYRTDNYIESLHCSSVEPQGDVPRNAAINKFFTIVS